MNEIRIPLFGPGSQSESAGEPSLDYIRMPTAMRTYHMPAVPEPAAVAGREQGMRVLEELLQALAGGQHSRRFDISDLGPRDRDLVDQVLGSGEVSVIAGPRLQVQEAVLTGVWRVQEVDASGRLLRDCIEIADFPSEARELARGRPAAEVTIPAEVPAGVLNAPAVLTEIVDKAASLGPGTPPHVVNLTLLPQTPEDLAFLERVLGAGTVIVLSRGYGNCRVAATATDGVWWVQYFNSQDMLVLNTLEVVSVPEVARAAPEDLADSARRLEQILEVYR
ncbi:MAG: hydrogenase expression/formation protein [Gammaproteobacteria bacterium]|nr:hydrogenase expression/formation protein [Gammaproteobacteria bacterium]MDH4255310.1 hydrogenase expression/formation protein [Gammaproteobacteria bacterium]MDH5273119.1 hydrogenase expression/formation protein [Gammaproteobacteria bacterium]